MVGRTPQEAYQRFLEPLRAAIGCVAHGRFTLEHGQTATMLKAQMLYTLALNNMALVTMRGNVPITMSLGLHIRILELDDTRDPFAVATVKYYYKLATPNDEEILAFHWSPAAVGETAVRFPHLHVGPAVVSRSSEVRPRTFHKVHVPTGHVSIQSVIRLAITEFDVTPLRPDWQAILDDAESNGAH